MNHYFFVASETFSLNDFEGIDKFIERFPNGQSIYLNGDDELVTLINLIGNIELKENNLTNSLFEKYWDISTNNLPEFDEEEFDQFYREWLEQSKRENTMDEYGSLIFLGGLSTTWNKLAYRLIVKCK